MNTAPTEELVVVDSYPGPPRQDAADLAADADRADAEMSFAADEHRILPAPIIRTAELRTRLHRWSAPHGDQPLLAGVATARLVGPDVVLTLQIAPLFRSTGVGTAAVEALRRSDVLTVPSGARLLICCHGSHPAAMRMARRFGAEQLGERHHLLLPSASAYLHSRLAADGDSTPGRPQRRPVPSSPWPALGEEVPGSVELRTAGGSPSTVRIAVHGSTGILRDAAGPDRAGAVRLGVDTLLTRGARMVQTVADTADLELIDILRSAAFGHDRSDVLLSCPPLTPDPQPPTTSLKENA
ncbi:hypothetical protein [Gordonia sp. VNK21]|uniref:hypothetical protein n=1 Tax=Gordonia sp. VNK21 TaxID=3382483 RepID=UPI0038D47A90